MDYSKEREGEMDIEEDSLKESPEQSGEDSLDKSLKDPKNKDNKLNKA